MQLIPIQYYDYICEIADDIIQTYNANRTNPGDEFFKFSSQPVELTNYHPYFKYEENDPKSYHNLFLYSKTKDVLISETVKIIDLDTNQPRKNTQKLENQLHLKYLNHLIQSFHHGFYQNITDSYEHYQFEKNRRIENLRYQSNQLIRYVTNDANQLAEKLSVIFNHQRLDIYEWNSNNNQYDKPLLNIDSYGNINYFEESENTIQEKLAIYGLKTQIERCIKNQKHLNHQFK